MAYDSLNVDFVGADSHTFWLRRTRHRSPDRQRERRSLCRPSEVNIACGHDFHSKAVEKERLDRLHGRCEEWRHRASFAIDGGRELGKIKKGDLLVCNFANSAGEAGKGTTVELLQSVAGSKPVTFYQGNDIEGCDGAAVSTSDQVYVTGLNSKAMIVLDQNGQVVKTYGSPIAKPLGDGFVGPNGLYSYEYVFSGNSQTGAINKVAAGFSSASLYKPLTVVTGFSVNKAAGWSALGPSGFAYSNVKKIDTLYVVDGACNTVVSIYGAHDLLAKDEIAVSKNCSSFQCKSAKVTCGKVVLSGTPLNKPYAVATLPNGNLIVANTGTNELVEMTPGGQVLDTKVVDTSKTAGIFGLWASGKSDSNTVVYYTDANSNTVHELEK